jgi:peptidoglycan/LPS O-acetylase OafA/YrhL
MTHSKQRLIELDALRCFGLLLILYTHSTGYILEIPFLEWFRPAASYTGLGMFVFLSGYGLQYSLSSRATNKPFNPITFLQKRLIRIYPLYLVAFFCYVIFFYFLKIPVRVSGWDLSPFVQSFASHIFALQVFLYPLHTQLNTLWFVGMIIPFYIFFALTGESNNKKFIGYNALIFVTLLGINHGFGLIDFRLFLYYPFFVLGSLASRKHVIPLSRSQTSYKQIGVLGFAWLGTYYLIRRFDLLNFPKGGIENFRHFLTYGLLTFYLVFSIAFLIVLAYRLATLIKQYKEPILRLSNASYAAYLFHRVVYGIVYFLISNVLGLSDKIGTLLFLPVTLFLFLISDLIVKGETRILKGKTPEKVENYGYVSSKSK